jgi:hypothetical protein
MDDALEFHGVKVLVTEAGLQRLDALERLETVDRRFIQRRHMSRAAGPLALAGIPISRVRLEKHRSCLPGFENAQFRRH